ncbi:MAG: A/G-specific adenine glycosylase [Ruminococcaceae bacterium]|nr:A/G-specific adenine glycosylase [Oscillospiraceae bacterium]
MKTPLSLERLPDWFLSVRRSLPWRESITPYRVWVSEIMLQQTRIEAVIPYFERFMQAFPTIAALADADTDRLLKMWEGLGYYSRARNLQKAARIIVAKYGGEMPADYQALRALPGIGPYTAGAIASIAFGLPHAAIDGNVLRVMARFYDHHGDVLSPAVKAELTALVEAALPHDRPALFNQGLMELGETCCLPNTAPHCEQCPLKADCQGFAKGTAAQLPVRLAKKSRRVEQRTVLVPVTFADRPQVLLHKRPENGLLAGLWELPNRLTEEAPTPEEWVRSLGGVAERTTALDNAKHLFTHIEWQMQGIAVVTDRFSPPDGYMWVDANALRTQYALPSAFSAYTRALPAWLHTNK